MYWHRILPQVTPWSKHPAAQVPDGYYTVPLDLAEYLRCLRDPATIHGICEDYRASASIDLEHERHDLATGNKIRCAVLALWGKHGVIERCFDPLAEWKHLTEEGRLGGRALDCGHYLPEEAPDELLAEVLPFFHA